MGGSWWREIWKDESPGVRETKLLEQYMSNLSKLAGGYVFGIPCADRWDGPPSYWLIFVTQHPDGWWLFHESVSNAMEVYREFCLADKQRDLFDDIKVRNDEWSETIATNVKRVLLDGPFTVQDRMVDVYGDALGLAREKHVRAALKALHVDGVTSSDSKGPLQKKRVVPAT